MDPTYNYSSSAPTRGENARTAQQLPSTQALCVAPSYGLAIRQDQRDVGFVSATHSSAFSSNTMTFAVNQEVQVFYQGAWIPGVVVAGIHRIDAYHRLGYTVKFCVKRGRYIEGEFLQEYVKVAPADSQYT